MIPWILILIVFILVISYTFGQLAKIRGLIVDSLTRAQEESFWQSILYYLLVAGFLVLLDVSKRFTEDRLILKLRRTVNIDLLTRYLSFNVSYRIHLFRSVDNPDQRIEEDTRTFCAQTISLFLIVVGATATLVVQGGILFAVDKRLPWIAIAYAVVGSTLTFLVGKKLIILNWLQLMKEANYRFKLIGIRENSEAINFYRENQKEQTRTRQYLREAVKNMLKIIAVNRNLGLVTGTYNQLIWIVPHLLLAGDVLLGNKTYGDIITASVAFEHFLGALSLVVSHFSNLSSYAAVVGRLGDFYEKIEHASRFSTRVKPAKAVVFKNVSIYVPTEQLEIVSNLSFNHQGGGLLIIGDSGVGKSSVLRVIAGLWDSFTGEVYAPEAKESFFVPQKPYCFEGTLLSQLLFGVKKLPSLSRVIKTAELCGLGPTIEKHGSLNVVQDWNKVLSLGEQQKIAWVRLFLADRKFCFIDEMTTAVDIHFEELFYKELSMRAYLWISVGVRESLFKYHQVKLYLDGGGKWRLVE
ncbi:MAG: ATP-binding cassette domain-containing protein [Deltaproteobacteria bacterium]|nr:ATP-binding cassette domain-containing protein [Deltaproteobacteria bacterium]